MALSAYHFFIWSSKTHQRASVTPKSQRCLCLNRLGSRSTLREPPRTTVAVHDRSRLAFVRTSCRIGSGCSLWYQRIEEKNYLDLEQRMATCPQHDSPEVMEVPEEHGQMGANLCPACKARASKVSVSARRFEQTTFPWHQRSGRWGGT